MELYAKNNRQHKRLPKNMSKSIRLGMKKYCNALIKKAIKANKPSSQKVYEDMKQPYIQ